MKKYRQLKRGAEKGREKKKEERLRRTDKGAEQKSGRARDGESFGESEKNSRSTKKKEVEDVGEEAATFASKKLRFNMKTSHELPKKMDYGTCKNSSKGSPYLSPSVM